MSTVGKEIADEIIANNGKYKHDTQVWKVYKYTSKWGGECYKLIHYKFMALFASEYVIDPELIWEYHEPEFKVPGKENIESTLEQHLK